MQRLPPTECASSQIKKQKTAKKSDVDVTNRTEYFLEKLSQGLIEGVESYQHSSMSEREEFITTHTAIFDELYQHTEQHTEQHTQVNFVAIPLPDTTLNLKQIAQGVEMGTDGIKKILPGETLQSLMNKLYSDITTHPGEYGKEYSTYVQNRAWCGTHFKIASQIFKPSAFIDQSEPHIPNGEVRLIQNFNDIIPMETMDENFECTHFVAQFVQDVFKSPNGEVDLTHFDNEEAIADHISDETNATYKALTEHATRYDLIQNDAFGRHLKTFFEDMQSKKETVRALIIEPTSHSMAISLHIKENPGKPVYAVCFFDPNKTNVIMYCETDDLSTLENQSLELYVNGSTTNKNGAYQAYYNGVEPISLVMECNLVSLTDNPVTKEKKLETFPSDLLTPTMMYFLLTSNFFHDLTGLKDQIRKKSPDELFNLLGAQSEDGAPALFVLSQNGLTEPLRFCSALSECITDENKMAKLISSEIECGSSALFIALRKGNADIIGVLGHWIQRINDQNKRIELATAKDGTGTSGFHFTLQRGHAAVIPFFGQVIELIDDENERANLLAALNEDGLPGISYALEEDDTDTLYAYCALINKLITGAEARDKLIAQIRSGISDELFLKFIEILNG